MTANYGNILVVNVNWVGDVIFSTPVFKALKRNFPEAKVWCLAAPRVKEILESCPFVDGIIIYDEDGDHRGPLGKWRLIRQIAEKKFDIAFLLHRSLTRALLVFLTGIPKRVGYDEKGRGFLLTHKTKALDKDRVHRSDYYLNVIESFGIPVGDRMCELSVDGDCRLKIDDLLIRNGIAKNDKIIIINPGGNWDLKRWPKENFATLLARMAVVGSERNADHGHARIVITGAKKDADLADSLLKLSGVRALVLTGVTTLKELMALFERSSLVISNDSGPLHIANCVGTPAIALFGPTRPEVTGPRGKGKFTVLQNDVGCNRSPCYFLGCPDNVCMKSITVDQVINEIRRLQN